MATTPSSNATPTVTEAIVIPAINTDAMRTVRLNNEIPFAVLHFLQCVPLLVRVIDFREQSLLRPANKEDFLALRQMARAACTAAHMTNKLAAQRISVPIVAAVYQTLDHNGSTSFVVMPPKNISKIHSDLQQLTTQDAVFSMALRPQVAVEKPQRRRGPAVTKAPASAAASKRQIKPNAAAPAARKRSKPESRRLAVQPPTAKAISPVVEAVTDPLVVDEEPPKPVVVQPLPSFEVVEQEHLNDTGDISEAIRGFATGSFLSPKRRVQVTTNHQPNQF